jgi:small subunit ribosomal protein S18
MSKIEEQSSGKKEGQIRYLTPLNIDTNIKKKYCRFKRSGIKYVDYKDPNFHIKFVNELLELRKQKNSNKTKVKD